MPYKEELTLSEIEPYLLPSIKDFIKEILDLYGIYGDKVKIPVAYPLKKETNSHYYPTYEDLSFAGSAIIYPKREDFLKGIYQDEAILKASADSRLSKIIMLKKLGVISSVSISSAPLETREISFYVREPEMKKIFNEIEKILEKKDKEEKETERKKNEIYYKEENCTINLEGKKPIRVSGWEDIISKVVFNPSKKGEEIDFGEIIYEMTGEQYQKSEDSRYMESVRQAVYRLNKKIKDGFDKDNYLVFSQKTRKLTKTQTN